MRKRCRIRQDRVDESRKVRVGALAARQSGRIAAWQLTGIVSRESIANWTRQGYLHRVVPGVYAVGHRAASTEGDLAAALLYAGRGAMLSHTTAAWWYGLLDRQPHAIHISTPLCRRSRPGICVHSRRTCERVTHKSLPITTPAQTVLDFASTSASLNRVRVVLANAEFRELLDRNAVRAVLGRGRPGSTKLRQALKRHEPRLAYARSRKEIAFFTDICERHNLPRPKLNARIAGWDVDFYWPDYALVVEVDPPANHHTPAQIDRDRRKDLALRARQLVVHRYSQEQLEDTPDVVAGDAMAALRQRRPA